MRTTIQSLLRVLRGAEAGAPCRCCGEAIPGDDPFGISETVCRPCRFEASA